MPNTTNGRITLAILGTKLDLLSDAVKETHSQILVLQESTTKMSQLPEDIRQLEESVVTIDKSLSQRRAIVDTKIADLTGQIGNHEARLNSKSEQIVAIEKTIATMREAISSLVPYQKVLTFVGSALGTAIIGFILSLIFGKAEVTFR